MTSADLIPKELTNQIFLSLQFCEKTITHDLEFALDNI